MKFLKKSLPCQPLLEFDLLVWMKRTKGTLRSADKSNFTLFDEKPYRFKVFIWFLHGRLKNKNCTQTKLGFVLPYFAGYIFLREYVCDYMSVFRLKNFPSDYFCLRCIHICTRIIIHTHSYEFSTSEACVYICQINRWL